MLFKVEMKGSGKDRGNPHQDDLEIIRFKVAVLNHESRISPEESVLSETCWLPRFSIIPVWNTAFTFWVNIQL